MPSESTGLPSRRRLAHHYLALAASGLDRQIGRCLFVIENGLAVVLMHFLRYLPRPFPTTAAADSGSSLPLGTGSNQLLEQAAASLEIYNLPPPSEADAAKLGSQADLAYFMSRLQVGVKRQGPRGSIGEHRFY